MSHSLTNGNRRYWDYSKSGEGNWPPTSKFGMNTKLIQGMARFKTDRTLGHMLSDVR